MINLVEGRRYRTRNGKETGPVIAKKQNTGFYKFQAEIEGTLWNFSEHGEFGRQNIPYILDLVEEIIDVPPEPFVEKRHHEDIPLSDWVKKIDKVWEIFRHS